MTCVLSRVHWYIEKKNKVVIIIIIIIIIIYLIGKFVTRHHAFLICA